MKRKDVPNWLDEFIENRRNNTKSKRSFGLVKKLILNKSPELFKEIESYQGFNFAEKLFLWWNELKQPLKCKNCQKNAKFISFFHGFDNYCSSSCKLQKERGVKHFSQLESVKEKKKKTCLKKFGTENPMQCVEIQQKTQKTNEKIYGSKHIVTTKMFKDARNKFFSDSNKKTSWKQSLSKNNRKKSIFLLDEKIEGKFKRLFSLEDYSGCYGGFGNGWTRYPFLCLKCGEKFEDIVAWGATGCPKCDKSGSSRHENELCKILDNWSVKYKRNDRLIIPPLEIDIALHEQKIGIEINGLFWHGEKKGKDKTYHLKKTEMCEQNEWRLIQIFEDEFIHKKEIVFGHIKSFLNLDKTSIGARKLTVKEISKEEKRNFLDLNHIQGNDRSSIKLGAFLDDELVAVMTFSKLRKALGNKHVEDHWEISRMATKIGTTFPGVGSKMLSFFEKNWKWSTIVSYCDKRWHTGKSYQHMGFTLDHISPPNYWYIDKKGMRKHRFGFTKHLLSKKLEHFDPLKTEWENMQANGWDRIWDCGCLVFKKEKKQV